MRLVTVRLQPETTKELARVPAGTVAGEASDFGIRHAEPLIVAMDAMIRYAKAYHKAYESYIGDDNVLGDEFTNVITGIRGLLNGHGAVAMEMDVSTDSKDNGSIEALFWQACELADISMP